MAQEGHHILNYIDDHLIFRQKSDCQEGFDRLTTLLGELGLDISVHKNVEPSKWVVCLGILIDTDTLTMSVSEPKL